MTDYLKSNGVSYEWHYIDVADDIWKRNIIERNKRIEESNGTIPILYRYLSISD